MDAWAESRRCEASGLFNLENEPGEISDQESSVTPAQVPVEHDGPERHLIHVAKAGDAY